MTSQQSVIFMLWGNTSYYAKLSGEDLSRYSNKIESVGLRKCPHYDIISILLRKWCHNNKHFSELAPHHGEKTADIDTVWRNSIDVTLCISKTPFTRYNRLSNWLYNRFDNRLYRVNKHSTGCQFGCQTGLTTVFYEQHCSFKPVVKPRCTTGLTNTVWQPCWTNSHCSFNRLSNRVV